METRNGQSQRIRRKTRTRDGGKRCIIMHLAGKGKARAYIIIASEASFLVCSMHGFSIYFPYVVP